MSGRFEDRVAVVTGSGSGIGAAVASALLAEGATVVGLDLAHSDSLVAEFGDAFSAIRTDVTTETEIESAIAAVIAEHGKLDLAFNVAGASRGAPITQMERSQWDFTVDLVLTGVFLSTKHEARAMTGGGAIVNIGSINGRIPMYGGSAYVSAKAGVEAFTRNAALELGRHGIRVNSVLPGLVETPLTSGYRGVPALLEAFTDRIVLGRTATVQEIAGPALYLASDDASYVTGASLVVDGGWDVANYPDLTKFLPGDSSGTP